MKKQTLFAIGIPTINRADLLEETLIKYKKDFPNTTIFVADNGHQHFKDYEQLQHISWIINSENLGVSGTWNQLCNEIFSLDNKPHRQKHDYALILNDDVYFGAKEHEVAAFIFENLSSNFMTTTHTWCNFLLNRETYLKVGEFDEKIFPAYFEDNDYAYRLKLAGEKIITNRFMDPDLFRNSMTIAKDNSFNANFEKNRQYFIQKWGGIPGEEKFTKPFNQ